jgi:hypothetical protein
MPRLHLPVSAVLLTACLILTASQAGAQDPKDLDAASIAAWKKAAAKVGWVVILPSGVAAFEPSDDKRPRLEAFPKGSWMVPAFRFQKLPEDKDRLPELSPPEVPFGLLLRNTPFSDAGLPAVAKYKQLVVLDLAATKVTDAGLKELAACKQLQALVLVGQPVSDAGVKELTALTELQLLDLRGTKITETGLNDIKKALPKCKVMWQK